MRLDQQILLKSPPLSLLTGSALRARVNTLINERNIKYEVASPVNLRYCYLSRRATQNMSQFPHHWYERTLLTAISSHCLAALPAKMSAFSSCIKCDKTAYLVTSSGPLKILSPSSCDATKVNSRTIHSRVSQPAFVVKSSD